MQSIDHAQIVASEPVDSGSKPDAPIAKILAGEGREGSRHAARAAG